MLILTRNIGESIVIGDSITVTVLGVDRGQLRIGVTTPKEINIVREELLERSGDYVYREWFTKNDS